MTLLDDLETLTGSQCEAAHISAAITAGDTDRAETYGVLLGVAQAAAAGFVRALALLMKYETEQFANEALPDGMDSQGTPGHWYARELYTAFATCKGKEFDSVDADDLRSLLSEMRLLRLDRVPTDSAALNYIADQRQEICAQLKDADDAVTRKFLELRKEWVRLNERLVLLSQSRREISKRTEALQREFLAIFAKDYLAEQSAHSRLGVAQLRLELLRENPGANAATIEDLVRHEQSRRKDNLKMHQLSADFGRFFPRRSDSINIKKNYRRAIELLRKLAMLTHPDRVSQLDIGRAQKEQLGAIWHETNKIRTRRNNEKAIGNSVQRLEAQLQFVERVLALAGITDLDVAMVVQGATVAEQLTWLETANAQLRQRVASLQADVFLLNSHQEIRYFAAMIEAPTEVQDEERTLLEANARQFREEAIQLELTTKKLLAAYA